jgi:hypothetical protein
MTYGFSGLNKNLNSNRNNGFNIGTALKTGTIIIPARVISIVLNETHPKFLDLGEWNALGAIEYELVENPNTNQQYPIAYPLSPNVKNYPLVNEIVYLISLPNDLIGETNVSKRPYYINIVSLWNHPHHNAYPSLANESDPPQQKDYIQTQAGSTKVVTNENKQIFLGETFKEKTNIHPLLPFEGDVIQEGRWGNSIRLGSTVTNSSSGIKNNWSSTGNNGDPITIIRNGQGEQAEQGWIPITENINNTDSSIYLTSTQKIPLKAISTSYVSYSTPPTSPDAYNDKQIILNSGRLMFNSIDDHILLSSAKSINLNSIESVNIDTKKFITQADNIFLGKEELANQPLMLGNSTVDLIKNMLSIIKDMSNTLKTLTSDPVAPNSSATFTSISNLPSKMGKIQISIKKLEDQINSGALTSQRNFTL